MRTGIIALTCLVAGASAQVRPLTLDDLCRNATRIVAGEVTKLSSRFEGTRIVTDVTMRLTETLKGRAAPRVTFKIPGGTVGGLTLNVSETPTFTKGEQAVVFLRPGNVPCDVYGWFRGKYSVVNGRVRELKGRTATKLHEDIVTRVRKRKK